MYKKLLVVSLLPCLCFAEAKKEDTKLLGEVIEDQLKDVPLLSGLSIDGKLNLAFVTSNQSLSHDVEDPSVSLDGDINIKYKKVIDGIGVGIHIGTKARSGILKSGSAIVDTSYAFLETDKLGQFRIGYSKSAGSLFSVSYADVLTGYNLPDSGNIATFFAQTSGTILGTGFDKDDSKALKIVWLSPTFYGWSVGLSYAPSSRDGHLFKEKRNKVEKDYSPTQNFADQTSYTKHNFTAGLSYEYGDPEAFNIKISLAGWLAKSKTDLEINKLRDVKGYNIGAILGYKKFKLALGFTDNMDTMIPRGEYLVDKDTTDSQMCAGANAGKIYNIGMGYTFGKLETSVGFFHAVKKWSKSERSQANIATAAVQYNLDKMVSIYAEYDNIRARTCDRIYNSEFDADGTAYGNNRANLFIVGAKFKI